MKNNDHKIPLFSIAFVSCPFQPISFRSGKIGLMLLLGWLHCCKRRVVAFMLVFYIITRTTFTKMENVEISRFAMAAIFLRCVHFNEVSAEFNIMMYLWQGSLITSSDHTAWVLEIQRVVSTEFNLGKRSTCFSFHSASKWK